MSKGLIDLISILDLEPLEVNLFRGVSPKTSWQRVFGGQVIGQAMVAACRTVEGRLPHSLHCYFILPGDPQIPIIYEVERLRDGKSYTTRRVTAIQHGNAIFSIMVSFHIDEHGSFDHQDKMPDVPPPEKLTAEEVAKQPMFREMPEFIRRYYESDRPIELRPVELGRDLLEGAGRDDHPGDDEGDRADRTGLADRVGESELCSLEPFAGGVGPFEGPTVVSSTTPIRSS